MPSLRGAEGAVEGVLSGNLKRIAAIPSLRYLVAGSPAAVDAAGIVRRVIQHDAVDTSFALMPGGDAARYVWQPWIYHHLYSFSFAVSAATKRTRAL